MADEITIITPENVELHFELAGLISRFAAWLIDYLAIAVIYTVIILLAILFGISLNNSGKAESTVLGFFLILFLFLPVLYYFLFETFMNGKTPGKLWLGLKVIRDTGHPLDMRGAFLRNIMRVVDNFPFFGFVGMFVVFFSSESRRLGDMVAGTLVIREPRNMTDKEKEQAAVAEASYRLIDNDQITLSELPDEVLAQMHMFTKDDYRTVRQLVDRSVELDASVVKTVACKIAAAICQKMQLDISTITDPLEFLKSLAAEWERRKVR